MNLDANGSPGQHKAVDDVRFYCEIELTNLTLDGDIAIPADASALVIFAHGSGSSRYSPRNRSVAAQLNSAGLATLLFDLLDPGEEADQANAFDIQLLSRRLVEVTKWVKRYPALADLPIGYFAANTGTAAALVAAADLEHEVSAIVSRSGRPDLAGDRLPEVAAPTLLIVGEQDRTAVELNRKAQDLLTGCQTSLTIVPSATHLFDEPGALEQVAQLAAEWFLDHLGDTGAQ